MFPIHYTFVNPFFQLKKILSETPFQPEIPNETPIQILGMAGVASAQFDYLWITNARDDSWVQSSTYYGFIPYDCHKAIPGTTPETRFQMAVDITDKLVRSAENLVFSYTKKEGDEERERLGKEVYQSDYWQNEVNPRIDEFLIRDVLNTSTLLFPTVLYLA